MILNETPIRTSKNFNANNINIDIKELECLENPTTFNNRTIYIDSEKKTLLVNESFEDSERLNDLYEDGKLLISEITKDNFKLKYGISDESTDLSVAHANQPIRIVAKEDSVNTNVNIEFLFDEDNKTLIDKIEIYAEKNSNLNVIINNQGDLYV